MLKYVLLELFSVDLEAFSKVFLFALSPSFLIRYFIRVPNRLPNLVSSSLGLSWKR